MAEEWREARVVDGRLWVPMDEAQRKCGDYREVLERAEAKLNPYHPRDAVVYRIVSEALDPERNESLEQIAERNLARTLSDTKRRRRYRWLRPTRKRSDG